jgi:uncharacterized membrane protein
MNRSSSMCAVLLLILAGCQAADEPAGGPEAGEHSAPAGVQRLDDEEDAATFSAIAENETVRFAGTEPFWAGQVAGTALTYSTPETPDGTDITVTRFAGRGGVSWSGMYSGTRFTLAVTPGACSDGMSDRTYPFVATLEVEGEQRRGCAWTDRKPFSGPANP